ncbi:papain-like cysteine protease family protein [Oscillospiraceae bacterium 50-58]
MDRDDLASISEDDISSINKATLHNVASLTVNPPIQMYDIGDDSVYLQVEKLKQSTSTLCWAATAVSILRYKGRIDNSISDQKFSELYQSYMGENWSLVGQSTAFVTDFINTYFDKNEGKYVFRGTDWYDYESIWTSLNRDNPVYGEFIYPSQTTTHAMVVRAMNGYGWFGVMDPLVKDYRTGTYTGTGATRDFVVPNEVAGKTLTLIKYSFRS